MKVEIPEQTKAALNYLLQTAESEGVLIAGFAFRAEPPCIISFGNCTDHDSISLYTTLCDLSAAKKAAGLVMTETVQKPV